MEIVLWLMGIVAGLMLAAGALGLQTKWSVRACLFVSASGACFVLVFKTIMLIWPGTSNFEFLNALVRRVPWFLFVVFALPCILYRVGKYLNSCLYEEE